MSNQNTLIALDWLNPVLQTILEDLTHILQQDESDTDLTLVAQTLHQVAGALQLAQQPDLAMLARTTEQVCQAIVQDELSDAYQAEIIHSVILLQYEISQLQQTQQLHLSWLLNRIHYLQDVLGEEATYHSQVAQALATEPVLAQLPMPEVMHNFSQADLGDIFRQWQQYTLQLNTTAVGDSEYVAVMVQLLPLAIKLSHGNFSDAYRQVWHLFTLWLKNQIDQVPAGSQPSVSIQPSIQAVVKLLNLPLILLSNLQLPPLVTTRLAVDVLLQLAQLERPSDEITQLLTPMRLQPLNKSTTLFKQTLQKLEQSIYQLHEPTTVLPNLYHIKSLLINRGWHVYENYLDQIIHDIQLMVDDPSMADMLGWQVERQMQDLYTQLFQADEILESQIGSQSPNYANDVKQEAIRQTRLHLENIKLAFNHYTHQHDVTQLDVQQDIEGMIQVFAMLGLERSQQVVQDAAQVVETLINHQVNQLSWETNDAFAELIARFELFLDFLSYQNVNEDLLVKTEQQLNQVRTLVAGLISHPETQIAPARDKQYHADTVVYDDTGEATAPVNIATNPTTSVTAIYASTHPAIKQNLTEQALPTADSTVITPATTAFTAEYAEEISPALQQARSQLKPDDYSMDEDIQEIFIEEADEVLTDMTPLLDAWQAHPTDFAVLKDIRRGFHTLKGSGRMVGAFQVGETAWAVENMLNRVLDGTLPVTPELVNFIQTVHQQMPDLVADFAAQRTPSQDPAILVLKATNLLQQRPIDEGVPTISPVSMPVTNSLTETTTDLSQPVALATSEEASGQHNPQNDELSNAPVVPALSTETSATPDNLSMAIPTVIDEEMATLTWKDDDILDEDIQEIYVEEAHEVLEEITPLYEKWRAEPSDTATLKEIRRGFHTLKGSGRMVGANQLGELGWSIENMLNRVLDNTIVPTIGLVTLVGDVLHTFPSLVDIFAQSQDNYPPTIRQWAAIANAYSKNKGELFHYPFGSVQTMGQSASSTAPTVADETSQTAVSSAPVSAHSPTEVSEHTADNGQIRQVFVEESQELLAKIQHFLSENQGKDNVTVSDELIRAFHTLRGGAALAQVERMYQLSATVETSLAGLLRQEVALTAAQMDVLSSATQSLADCLDTYQQSPTNAQTTLSADDEAQIADIAAQLADETTADSKQGITVTQLLELGIDDLLDAHDSMVANFAQSPDVVQTYLQTLATQAQTLAHALIGNKAATLADVLSNTYATLLRFPEFTQDKQIINGLLAVQEQLINVFDAMAADLNVSWNDNTLYYLTNTLSEKKHAAMLAAIQYEAANTDVDLLDIFLEEASELEQNLQQVFTHWQSNLNSLEDIKKLQRYLHTIKGGARMVGLESIASLSFAVENIYKALVNKMLPNTTEVADVVQQAQDTIAVQLAYLRKEKRTFFANDLVVQLNHIIEAGAIDNTVALEVPIVVYSYQDEQNDVQETTTSQATPDTAVPVVRDRHYSQEIINNFEQRRLETWQGHEPDEDILGIYLDEAKDLIDSSSENLQEFRSNTSNIAALQALQRELHTIKGGARMVGAEGLANLAHEMETIYEELGTRRKPATRMIGNLLAACHDWLASALYVLENKYNPQTPKPLIDALLQFSKNPDSLKAIPQTSLSQQIEQIQIYQSSLTSLKDANTRDLSVMPPMAGKFEMEQEQTNLTAEMIRIPSNLMEQMINLSSESAINRSRIDMDISSLTITIEEMGVTVQRLADQLRRMETELEVQILSQIDDELLQDSDFDPLEMDQYSSLNQLSKSLSESASDLLDIKTTMLDKTRDTENLLLQLSRTQNELQEGLMSSRMVPFSRITPRLQRIVRQTANELNKSVELRILNDEGEIDRNVLDRITSPLEHMLRNAVDHGIEKTQERIENGKSRTGIITLEVVREGGEIVIYLTDDGKGVNVEAVRNKAVEQGLIAADDTSLRPVDIMQYIFNAGLSTSSAITQISGRGVGMDVVQSEVKQLGGVVSVDSEMGKGSRFIVRLPLTVAVTDALVVRAADKNFAVPLVQIERVIRINAETIYRFYDSHEDTITIDGESYRMRYLNQILYGSNPLDAVRQHTASVPVIIVRNETGQKMALHVDALAGSRIEVVVKPLGKQLAHIGGISSATIMGDGSVLLVLDLIALMRNATNVIRQEKTKVLNQTSKPVVMIIDDSVTVRKVTSRLLERNGYDTEVAKDGVDALEKLQEFTPDIMLLDIEMPRMDGFEVATQIRHNPRLKNVPIIMITSRTGEKHRERALSIGVNEYMGKPFQEQELLDNISQLLSARFVN